MTLRKMQTARESGPDPDKDTPTNRNFPPPSQDLAAAKAAGGGTAFDAEKTPREILPENQMLMELMERFRPERIISVHGTHGPGSAGVFYDKRSLRDDEKPGPWRAPPLRSSPSDREDHGEARLKADREAYEKQAPAIIAQRTAAADQTDRDLSLKAAAAIDTATAPIPKRGGREFSREKETKDEIKERRGIRAKHPSVSGNVGSTGKLDRAIWSGSTPEGISLGKYAPARGMSVFTVEPPLNYRSDDPARLEALSAAERKAELKAYADAIRTILLGTA